MRTICPCFLPRRRAALMTSGWAEQTDVIPALSPLRCAVANWARDLNILLPWCRSDDLVEFREGRCASHGAAAGHVTGAGGIGIIERLRRRMAETAAGEIGGAEAVAGAGRVDFINEECRAADTARLGVQRRAMLA